MGKGDLLHGMGMLPIIGCVSIDGEEVSGVTEGPSFLSQEPRHSHQMKMAATGPLAEQHCWPVEAACQTGAEPTFSQGKASQEQPSASSH